MSARRALWWCAAWLALAGSARASAPTVTVSGGAPGDEARIRAAVARELAADDAGGAVEIKLGADELEVTARLADGRVITRAIARPTDPSRVAEAAAMLAGNLSRDQTSDLEAELRRRRARGTQSSPRAPSSTTGSPAPRPPAPAPEQMPSCATTGPALPALELWPGVVLPGDAGDPQSTRAATFALVGGHRGPTRGLGMFILGAHGSSSVCGLHISGLWDWSLGWVKGAQLSGGAVSATRVDGVQVATLARATSTVRGAQLAAVALARDVEGAQVSLVSVARDVRGAQVAALNVARRARGVQLGLVNIADDSDAPIGLVNVIRHGRLHVDAWALDLPGVAVGVVHGGRYMHTIYAAGARRGEDGDAHAVAVAGLGGHVPIGARAFIDLDALTYFLPDRRVSRIAYVYQVRVIGGVSVGEGLSLFAGPTLNLSQSPPEIAEPLGVFGARALDWGGGAAWRAWPGVTVGARAF